MRREILYCSLSDFSPYTGTQIFIGFWYLFYYIFLIKKVIIVSYGDDANENLIILNYHLVVDRLYAYVLDK